MKTLTGIIRGRTIELSDASGLDDGAEVEVFLRPTHSPPQPGAGFLQTEGALADDLEWDAIMDELQQSRRVERSPAAPR